MFRRFSVVMAAAVSIFSTGMFQASAASVAPAQPRALVQAAPTCTDSAYLTALGKDLTDLGTAFKAVDMKTVSSVAQLFVTLAGARQKYENTAAPAGCADLQLETIIAYGNASDLLVLDMGALSDTANASTYTSAMTDQATRFQNSMNNLLVLSGVATPAADSTPVGRASTITSTTCADATFLTGLGTDFSSMGSSMSAGMTSVGAISKGLLSLAVLRQKYEDMVVASGCEVTQLNTIITFANVTDLLGLSLAVLADPTNAATYTKVLTAQATRTQQWIQIVVAAATGATPAPMATAAK